MCDVIRISYLSCYRARSSCWAFPSSPSLLPREKGGASKPKIFKAPDAMTERLISN